MTELATTTASAPVSHRGPVAGEIALDSALRRVTRPPQPGERYHVRGLTALWAHGLGEDSVHTQRSYTHALALWLDYCLRCGVDPLRARRADADDWRAQLGTTNAETINARLAGVHSWYRYLLSNDIETRDPLAAIKHPKRNRRGSTTEYLDEAGLNALLHEATRRVDEAAADRVEIAARNAAILRIFATTGVRSGAVQQATVEDVRGELAGHRVLRYTTKGGQDRYKPLVPYAAAMVGRYLTIRAARTGLPLDQLTGLAFITAPYQGRPGGTALGSGALQKMIRTVAGGAGVPNAARLVPHSVRHTIGTLLARVRPLHEVQDFLDHADPRTTRIYVHSDETLNNSPAYTAMSFIHDDLNAAA